MTDAQQPLLADGGENGGEDRGSAVAARLEAGLSAEEGAVDFEQLLQRDPDHVIQYLADKGTKQLGSFITEVRHRSASWRPCTAFVALPLPSPE